MTATTTRPAPVAPAEVPAGLHRLVDLAAGRLSRDETAIEVGKLMVRHAQPLAHFGATRDPGALSRIEGGGTLVHWSALPEQYQGLGLTFEHNAREWRAHQNLLHRGDDGDELHAANGGVRFESRALLTVPWTEVARVLEDAHRLTPDLFDACAAATAERMEWYRDERPGWEWTHRSTWTDEQAELHDRREAELQRIERDCRRHAVDLWAAVEPVQTALF